MADGSRDDARDRNGSVLAYRERLFGIATAEDVDDALDKILPVDLDAPKLEEALEENDDRRDGKRHEQPEHGST